MDKRETRETIKLRTWPNGLILDDSANYNGAVVVTWAELVEIIDWAMQPDAQDFAERLYDLLETR